MRVLKDDGQMFLNLGDSYATATNPQKPNKHFSEAWNKTLDSRINIRKKLNKSGENWLKRKQKLMLPHRIAIALQDKGFIIREDIVWAKKVMFWPEKTSIGNNVPFPVKDRFGVSHEYIFQIVKSEKYFANLDAVKIKLKDTALQRIRYSLRKDGVYSNQFEESSYTKRLREKIKRQKEARKHIRSKSWNLGELNTEKANPVSVVRFSRIGETDKFLNHYARFPKSLVDLFLKFSTRKGDTVLDPFAGSGTTMVVAEELGRNSIGIELYDSFVDVIKKRFDKYINQKRLVGSCELVIR